jgi:hypothetical protein
MRSVSIQAQQEIRHLGEIDQWTAALLTRREILNLKIDERTAERKSKIDERMAERKSKEFNDPARPSGGRRTLFPGTALPVYSPLLRDTLDEMPNLRKLRERDQMIVEARKSGLQLQQIGTAFGISRERVRQIILKRGGGMAAAGKEAARIKRAGVRAERQNKKLAALTNKIRVSPSRSFACAIPTHENSTAAAGSNGLNVGTAAVVSVKATGQQVPKAEPKGAMPLPADLTEKVSAGRPERPAIPDLIPSQPGWQERARRLWAEYDNQRKAT